MSGLGLVKVEGPIAQPLQVEAAVTDVHFDDTLACGERLWVRGQIISRSSTPIDSGKSKSRWWRRSGVGPSLPDTVQLVTEIAGGVHEATASLDADGRFEARFPMPLAVSQRGWRIARHRVTFAGQKLEASNVVLLPTGDSAGAIVVILPIDFTTSDGDSLAPRCTGPSPVYLSCFGECSVPVVRLIRFTTWRASLIPARRSTPAWVLRQRPRAGPRGTS